MEGNPDHHTNKAIPSMKAASAKSLLETTVYSDDDPGKIMGRMEATASEAEAHHPSFELLRYPSEPCSSHAASANGICGDRNIQSDVSSDMSVDMELGPIMSATRRAGNVELSASMRVVLAQSDQRCNMSILRLTKRLPHSEAQGLVCENSEVDGPVGESGIGTEYQNGVINCTLSLAEAIERKYLSSQLSEDVEGSTHILIIMPTRTTQLPATLVLNDCDIENAGSLEDKKSMCADVRELDLTQNKIQDLIEVHKIMLSMHHLTFLNLSSNDLSKAEAFPSVSPLMESMKWLVLNGTRISWNMVEAMLAIMPNLQELYLSLNNYEQVCVQEDVAMPSVHLIHVSGNPFGQWKEIERLGRKFPALEALVMADCQLAHLGAADIIRDTFPHLHSLNMNNNMINNWEEVDKLRQFPTLKDVRILGQPLFENYSQPERRQLVISRLPNVERLNGSRISDEEREDAERAFIRYYMGNLPEDRPSRYQELVNKHGQLEPLAEVDMRPQTVVQVLVEFEERRAMKSINVRQTVAAFKASLQDFTGLGANKMRVFYIDKEMQEIVGAEELRINSKMLYTYNVRDGDEFHVDRKG